MKVVVISASPRKTGKTQVFMEYVTKYIDETNFENDKMTFINLSEGGIDYYTGDGTFSNTTKQAIKDITEADVWIIGTPIYNSFFSSALKNHLSTLITKKQQEKQQD